MHTEIGRVISRRHKPKPNETPAEKFHREQEIERIVRRRDATSCALRRAIKRYAAEGAEALTDYWICPSDPPERKTATLDRCGDLSTALDAIRTALANYVTHGGDPVNYIGDVEAKCAGARSKLYRARVALDIAARIAAGPTPGGLPLPGSDDLPPRAAD